MMMTLVELDSVVSLLTQALLALLFRPSLEESPDSGGVGHHDDSGTRKARPARPGGLTGHWAGLAGCLCVQMTDPVGAGNEEIGDGLEWRPASVG